MDATCTITWVNPVTDILLQVTLRGLCFDREEIIAALESGAVVVLASDNSLAFTCIELARLNRVQTIGDYVIWPNGLSYRVATSPEY